MSGPNGDAAPRERLQGVVLWFSEPKGWGIVRDARDREVPVDYAAISGEGYRVLRAGQRVELELANGSRGPVVERVTVAGGPAAG